MVNSPGGYWSGSTRTNPSMSVGSLVVVASSATTTPGHLRGPWLIVSCQGEATGSQTLLVTAELVLMTRDMWLELLWQGEYVATNYILFIVDHCRSAGFFFWETALQKNSYIRLKEWRKFRCQNESRMNKWNYEYPLLQEPNRSMEPMISTIRKLRGGPLPNIFSIGNSYVK